MVEVVWSNDALTDIREIRLYIARDNPEAAARVADGLIALGESLIDFPRRGRARRDGTRELATVPPYVLRYAVDADRVTILRIRHGARHPDSD